MKTCLNFAIFVTVFDIPKPTVENLMQVHRISRPRTNQANISSCGG